MSLRKSEHYPSQEWLVSARDGETRFEDTEDIKNWWFAEDRQAYQRAFMNVLSAILAQRTMPGEGTVRALIAQGEAEKRLFDISSLSVALGQPRTNTHRLIEYLVGRGVIQKTKRGRRVELLLTAYGWREMKGLWVQITPLIDEFVSQYTRSQLLDNGDK